MLFQMKSGNNKIVTARNKDQFTSELHNDQTSMELAQATVKSNEAARQLESVLLDVLNGNSKLKQGTH